MCSAPDFGINIIGDEGGRSFWPLHLRAQNKIFMADSQLVAAHEDLRDLAKKLNSTDAIKMRKEQRRIKEWSCYKQTVVTFLDVLLK